MQDHQPLPDRTAGDSSPKSSNCSRTHQEIGIQFERRPRMNVPFESRFEALRRYKAKHGHLRVSKKENKSLFQFLANINQSVKRIQEGKKPPLKITRDRITALIEIGLFNFKPMEGGRNSITRTITNVHYQDIPFESRIEALRQYQVKHGHMNVTTKEDVSLYNWISKTRQSVKRIQQGQTPVIKLTPNRMKMLQEIGFYFQGRRVVKSFESRIEALRLHQAKHGHMRVSTNEDKSLYNFVTRVKQSVKKIQEGKKPPFNITPDQITALEEVGFIVKPLKRGRNSIVGTPSTSCTSFKRQRVEERLYTGHEEIPTSRMFSDENNSKDTEEEIEGDIIPKWLISDEDEEDNGDSLLDEISIEIDGETKVN